MNHDTLHQLTPEAGATPRHRCGWLAVAIMAHVLGFLAYLQRDMQPPPIRTPPRVAPAPLSLAEHRQAVQASRVARAKLKRPPAAPRPPTKTEPLKGQIVEIARSADDRAPSEAAYLAEHNASVAHETRSRHVSKDPTNITPEPLTQADKSPPQLNPPTAPEPAATKPAPADAPSNGPQHDKSASPGQKQVSEQIARDRLALRQTDVQSGHQNRERTVARDGRKARDEQQPAGTSGPRAVPAAQPGLSMADLIPSVGALARLSGGPSNDALQDLDEGEGTFLNAREFKYASYFIRIKRGVADKWRAADEYQRRDPTGNIYGYRSRTTDVHVTLDRFGGLKTVTLAGSSGVDFLDREGLEAFRAAAPFPNPPKALLDAAEEIRFQFSFVFSIGRQGFFAAPYD